MQKFNRRLQQYRRKLGCESARHFAHQKSWDERTWYRIESGDRASFTPGELLKIARDLKAENLSVEEFLGD